MASNEPPVLLPPPQHPAFVGPHEARIRVSIGPQMPSGYTMVRRVLGRGVQGFAWSSPLASGVPGCRVEGIPGTFMSAFMGAWRRYGRSNMVGGRIEAAS